MTEADEKRLAGLRAIYAGEPDDVVGAFLLRLLDTERAERARLGKERESWRVSAAELSREYLARATQAESALSAAREAYSNIREQIVRVRGWEDDSDDDEQSNYSVYTRLLDALDAVLTPETPPQSEFEKWRPFGEAIGEAIKGREETP